LQKDIKEKEKYALVADKAELSRMAKSNEVLS
jgi:hypothetical protein